MKVFLGSFRKKNPIRENFSQNFPGRIWRFLIDSRGRYIAFEIRNKTEKSASFFVYDVSKREVIAANLKHKEDWWTGLEEINDGIMILHAYRDPKLPGRKGLYAYQSETGLLVWESPESRFFFSEDEKVFGYKEDLSGRIFQKFNLYNGMEEAIRESDVSIDIQMQRALQKRFSGYLYPSRFEAEAERYNVYLNMIQKYEKNRITGHIDCLPFGDLFFFSYYILDPDGNRSNNFLVTDRDGKSSYMYDCLLKDVAGYGDDTFFLRNKNLYMIKDGTRIQVFDVDA